VPGSRLVWFAWLLAGLTLVLEIADTLMTASYRALFSEATIAVHGWPFNTFAVIGSSFMGALIVSRYPRQPVGWLLSAVGTGASISLTLEAYSIWVLDHEGPGSTGLGQVTGWLSLFSGGPYALTLLTIMLLIAPDGALLSRHWRWAAAVGFTGLGCFLIGLLILPGLSAGDMVLDEGETGGAAVTRLFTVGLWLITVGLTASVVSAVIRMHRAHGVLHQQLRWILASGVFLPAGLIWRQAVQHANGGDQTWLATLPLLVAYCFIPICTAVAILHYRLYDIEVIINRAVVLAVGTAFVAVGYVALVVGLGGQVGSRTGGFWPSLLATAVVALAFQPLRSWVSHLADRAAYGSRAVPYEALSDFSQRLGDALAPQALLPAVAQAAGQVVSARRATASLLVPGGRALTASWPETAEPGEASFEVAVLDGGEALGAIAVTTPPGRNIRAGETRLLQDLADQASVAFRNASLDAEAEAHLAVLKVRADDLAASRRRIVEARDAECRRLEATISGDVFPLLDRLEVEACRLRDSAEAGQPLVGIEPLAAEVSAALETLRELSHGLFPSQLERAGLGPAISSYLAKTRSSVSLRMHDGAQGRRFGARAEAAAYFCCVEAVPHCASDGQVFIQVEGDVLVLRIDGFVRDGVDLQQVNDRVEALAGSLHHEVSVNGVLSLRVPIDLVSQAQPA
jgi:hypothetical protein